MPAMIDLTGQRFGKLTALEAYHKRTKSMHSQIYWKCICDCGNTVEVASGDLRGGRTKSCGCYKTEWRRTDDPRLVTAKRIFRNHKYNDSDLTFEQFLEISQQNCFYCGAPLFLLWGTTI